MNNSSNTFPEELSFINYSQENPQVFSLWDELAINKYKKCLNILLKI